MKSYQSILILFFIVCLISACSKDDDLTKGESNEMSIPNSLQISKIESLDANNKVLASALITYDNLGRIKSVNSTNDTSFMSYSVLYDANQIVFKKKYNYDYTYLVDSSYRTFKFSTPYESINFQYDSLGYVSKISRGSSSNFLIYENGILTKMTTNGSNSYITFEYTQDQYMNTFDIAEPLSFHINSYYIPYGFFGKKPKNMLKEVTEWFWDSRTSSFYPGYVTKFEYTKNAQGKINTIKKSAEYKASGKVDWSYSFMYRLTY